MTFIAILSCAIALAWVPLAVRFQRGWKSRRNPVSLAICAGCLLFAYTNVLFALALLDAATWRFFAIATHVFNVIVVVNFYVSFAWSDRRFQDERTRPGSIPVPNTTSTPRRS